MKKYRKLTCPSKPPFVYKYSFRVFDLNPDTYEELSKECFSSVVQSRLVSDILNEGWDLIQITVDSNDATTYHFLQELPN